MRFLLRYALFALLGGLVLGLVLRAAGARRRFGTLTVLALLPVVGHATYLAIGLRGAGVGVSAAWPFAALILADLVVAALLIRRWHLARMLWSALTPAAATLLYGAIASVMLRVTVEPADLVPSAVAAAAVALFALLFAATLLVLVPGEPRSAFPDRAGDR